ncbi:MAG: H-NS histone family protein [Methylococcales bacterium]|jgi:DNA-binding protein H-NS
MNELAQMSEQQLKDYINNAEKVLENRQSEKRKEVLSEIHQLAQSIGVNIEITDKKTRTRRGAKVAAKFQSPVNPSDKWSGRGMKPNWMKALVKEGYKEEDMRI